MNRPPPPPCPPPRANASVTAPEDSIATDVKVIMVFRSMRSVLSPIQARWNIENFSLRRFREFAANYDYIARCQCIYVEVAVGFHGVSLCTGRPVAVDQVGATVRFCALDISVYAPISADIHVYRAKEKHHLHPYPPNPPHPQSVHD